MAAAAMLKAPDIPPAVALRRQPITAHMRQISAAPTKIVAYGDTADQLENGTKVVSAPPDR